MLQENDLIVAELEVYDKNNNLLAREKMIAKLGSGFFNKRIEQDLIGKDENKEITLEYDVENNPYGKRNPSLVRLVPLREFYKRGIKPIPGLVVTINGLPAVILSISGGRVLVDFNHPLAGKELVIKVKDIKKLDKKEWVKELANYLGMGQYVEEKEGKLIVTNEFLRSLLDKLGVKLE